MFINLIKFWSPSGDWPAANNGACDLTADWSPDRLINSGQQTVWWSLGEYQLNRDGNPLHANHDKSSFFSILLAY